MMVNKPSTFVLVHKKTGLRIINKDNTRTVRINLGMGDLPIIR